MSFETHVGAASAREKQTKSTGGDLQPESNKAQSVLNDETRQKTGDVYLDSEHVPDSTANVVTKGTRGSPEESEAAIKQFLQCYKAEKSIYDRLALETEKICKAGLRDKLGSKFLTMSRGKELGIPVDGSMGTLEKSIRRRLQDRLNWEKEKGHYKDLEDVRDTMHDLAGARILLAFPDDDGKVRDFVMERFEPRKSPQWHGVDGDGKLKAKELAWGDLANRFAGYRATHYVVDLGPEADQELKGKQVEIQVTSMTMYAWQEVNHDLNYKVSPKVGALTDDEKRTLDMVNGLVHANEIALNQFHASLNRRVLLMDTVFATDHDLALWLREYIARKWALNSDQVASKIIPLAPGFGPLFLEIVVSMEYETPRKLQSLLEENMPQVNSEPLITIRRAVTKFEDQYVREDKNMDFAMWPVLRMCLKHSWICGGAVDQVLDRKIFFLLNHAVLSKLFKLSWTFEPDFNLYIRKSIADPERLFLDVARLVHITKGWRSTDPGWQEIAADMCAEPLQDEILPERVEESWVDFWKNQFTNSDEYSCFSPSINTPMFIAALALLGITADLTSQRHLGRRPEYSDPAAWHWPILAPRNTALDKFQDYVSRVGGPGSVCTALLMQEGHWRKLMMKHVEMEFVPSEPPKELQKILVKFSQNSPDREKLEWVHGLEEGVNGYLGSMPQLSLEPIPSISYEALILE